MIFLIERQDGVVELRDQNSIPQGAIVVEDALLNAIRQAVSAGKVPTVVDGSVVFLDAPPPTADDLAAQARKAQDEADALAAKQYAKLRALATMTPVQVLAWVQANVTNLAAAQDAIATLSVAVSVLARRL